MQKFKFNKKAVPYYLWGGFLFILLIGIDQLSKYFVHPKFFNDRFAFSLPVPTPLMYLIYLAVLVGIAVYIFRSHRQLKIWDWVAWTLILAGALSNIGERVMLGSVRDFIYISSFHWTGIYNLADGYIIVGIIILLVK